MSRLALLREIDLFERYLCSGVQDSAAYEADPVESNLHELGHIFAAKGLTKAIRDRERYGRLAVEEFCPKLPNPDKNEYEAIAFTFLVARQIGYDINEGEIMAEANVSQRKRDVGDNEREVVKALGNHRIQELASDFVRLISGDPP